MFSNKNLPSKPTEWVGCALNSPQQDRQGDQKKQLPYKLLSFPSSKCSLWDHTMVGDVRILHLFFQRHPKINIEKTILSSGHIFLAPESKNATLISCTLCGRLLLTEDEKHLVIIFTKLKFDEEVLKTRPLQQSSTEYQAPVTFSATQAKHKPINFYWKFKEHAALSLQNSIQKKDAVVLNNFVKCKTQCQFESLGCSIVCHIKFCLVTLDTRFILKPILPISIILTALSRGLSDPAGNAFLHGEPKSGYITMDETRRVLLVLDSDPKVTSLPIVGIWIGGIETMQHPFVWASCIRYLNMGSFGKQICVPPDPFLVLVYEKPTFKPQFYDCILDSLSSSAGFVMYTGSCETVLDQANIAKSHKSSEWLQTNDSYLSFTLDLMDDTTNAPLKPATTASIENTKRKNSFEGSSSWGEDLHRDSGKASGSSKDSCCSCSCKSRESFGNPGAGTTSANVLVLANTPRQEEKYTEIPAENLTIPNHDIFGLYLAQEQQIKQLKEQLDNLLNKKETDALSVDGSSKDENRQVISSTIKPPKTVISAGTMTSLAWPAPSLANDSHQQCPVTSDDNGAMGEPPSPEINRRQVSDSEFQPTFLNSMADSLTNLQLPSFGESMESKPPSIVVDLPDYPESLASLSRNSYDSEFNLGHSTDLFGESSSLMPTSASETEDDSAFYGNLLKKIQTILSYQESSDEHETESQAQDSSNDTPAHLLPSNERMSFNSLLIPHLNYISMLPTDITSDQSLEFCSLALKYLNKCSSKLPLPASGRVFNRDDMTSMLTLYKAKENNLSFASRQYLEKHGLSCTAKDKESISKTVLS